MINENKLNRMIKNLKDFYANNAYEIFGSY